MAGTFRFKEFLSEEERRAFELLHKKMAGKTVYFPYLGKTVCKKYIIRRNNRIRKMYRKYKKAGLKKHQIYAEISIRLTAANKLSLSHIRNIIHGYLRKEK